MADIPTTTGERSSTGIVTMRDLSNKLDALSEKLSGAGIPEMKADVQDHELRLRELEKTIWRASGIATLGGAFLAVIVQELLGRIQ